MSLPIAFPTSVPMLRDERICLRELCEADIPAWYARATDAESADLAGDPIPESVDMGIPWLQRQRNHLIKMTGIRWAVVPQGETESVGTVGLSIRPRLDIADLSVVISRSHWRRGIGTSAVCLASDYALRKLGIEELQAEVLQRNRASIRLLEKAGFALLRAVQGTSDAGGDPEACYLYSKQAGRTSAA
jgi:[ribosomal protein S5]-alanine N-acetyltransferase